MNGPALIGRDQELDAVAEVLRAGRHAPAALVLYGEPGIGKTSVWSAAVVRAHDAGFRVLTARPAEADSGLALAVLADLFTGAIAEFGEGLPAPQVAALRAGLLLDDVSGAPDERALNAGVLSLVRATARTAPVAIALDDVQWVDRASWRALAFVVRRLSTERIALVLTRRGAAPDVLPLGLGDATAVAVEARVLGALAWGPLGDVVAAHLGRAPPIAARRRLHDISGGNPFFAIELARAVGLDGLREAADPVPAPPTLAAVLRGRIDALSPAAREVLSIVAALPQPTFAKVAGAAGGDATAALSEAFDAGVLRRDADLLRFSHPLLGSVAYGQLSAADRRTLHKRLAGSAPDVVERGHHLALATTVPDAEAAAVVESAAEAVARRGGLAVAADLLGHARRLTPVDDAATRRSRAAAEAVCRSLMGQTEAARRLMTDALAMCGPGVERARLLYELARSASWGVDWREAAELLHEALEHCGDSDPHLQARLELHLGLLYTLCGDRPAAVIRHAGRAAQLADALGDETSLAEALANLGRARILTGEQGDAELERAVQLEPATAHLSPLHRPSDYLVEVHLWRDEPEAALERLDSLLKHCSARGEETAAAWTLWRMGFARCALGDPHAALELAERTRALAVDNGQVVNEAVALALAAHVAAHQGDGARAAAAGERACSLAAGRGAPVVERMTRASLAALDLADGRYAQAHERLRTLVETVRTSGVREPGAMRFVPDEIEALVGLGRLDEAEELLEWYAHCASAAQRRSALVAQGRCRALLLSASGDAARGADVAARTLDAWGRGVPPFDHGRAQLVLGIVERRAKRKRAARDALEIARRSFYEVGAGLWARRAGEELARIGGRRPAGDSLTPTERRVATLVAEGHTNHQVAAELFVSVRSVEANLTRVYAKLAIQSRTELAAQRERLGL